MIIGPLVIISEKRKNNNKLEKHFFVPIFIGHKVMEERNEK